MVDTHTQDVKILENDIEDTDDAQAACEEVSTDITDVGDLIEEKSWDQASIELDDAIAKLQAIKAFVDEQIK